MDLVLVDPGTVVGPNYRSNKVCLECLKLLGMAARQLEHVVLYDQTIAAIRSAWSASSC
jgi:hypothetical protein